MPNSHSENSVAQDWDRYWKGSQDQSAFGSGGVNHPAILAFWTTFFRASANPTTRIIDIASGTGAVIEAATHVDQSPGDFICVDTSIAAINTLCSRFLNVQGLVADASQLPLEDESQSMATSQFGLEYAGKEAFTELIRVLAQGGRLALVLHCDHGIIFNEAAASLDATKRLKESEFLPLATEMFKAGFAIYRGANPAEFEAAAKRLMPAFKSLEPIMDEHGVHVAGDTICELYNEVARIQGRMQHHDEQEVINWLTRIGQELDAYAGRMKSMQQAALSKDEFLAFTDKLNTGGFKIQQAEALRVANHPLPLAWILTANKQ